MREAQMHLINKMFEGKTIRTVWDKDEEKYYISVVDIEEMFRIIESISSPNAEPMKLWLAILGKERIDEVFDPSITVQRAIDTYLAKGYDEDWIIKRIKSIQDKKKLTDIDILISLDILVVGRM